MSFKKRITNGEFVVLAELNTPKGVNISEMLNSARKIKERVDAIVVPDMDNGIMRMNALVGGVLMQQQGLESIIHVYCRDRNRMALQSDLLAAHVAGIQNVVVVQGEPMENGDCREAKPVDDLDEIGLLGAIQALNRGMDLSGLELNGSPDIFAGCAIPPVDEAGLPAEIKKAERKIAAGAGFVIIPAVYDVDHFKSQLSLFKSLGVPVIATVFLIKSAGIARYLSQNEPGAVIRDELIKRIKKSPDRDLECIKIAGETVAALKGLVNGVQIATNGWEHRLPNILDDAGI
jgi:methylenetetrahydrofolate reductase (NADPH)